MIEPVFKVRLDEVEAGIRAMQRQAERRKVFFQTLKKPAKQDVRDHQKAKRGESAAWPPLDPDTLAKRRRRPGRRPGRRSARARAPGRRQRGRQPQLLGRVPRAWKTFLSEDHFKLRNMVRWSGIHNTGGVAGRRARMRRRQFAYFSRAFLNDALAAYGAFVLQGWQR